MEKLSIQKGASERRNKAGNREREREREKVRGAQEKAEKMAKEGRKLL